MTPITAHLSVRKARGPRAASPAQTARSRRAAGFSLIELLVVIGILAVLISLAVIGFKVVGTASREKLTEAQFENCKSLLNEYEQTSSVENLLPVYPLSGWRDWLEPVDAAKPKTLRYGRRSAAAGAGPLTEAQETARVLAKLRSVPKNRAAIEAMAQDRVRGVDFPAILPPNVAAPGLPGGQGVVLLDGDGHDIYFVPGGGLTDVRLNYKGSGDRSASASYDNPSETVRAPDGRPFWVSVGPDGNLRTGDDNLYSFGK